MLATIRRALHLLRLGAADRLELAGFDDAQKRGLLFQAQGVDLVQQQRAVADGGELADLGAVGAGERTFDVAEKLAFDQVGRDGAARHGQEPVLLARRMIVDQPGQEGLAGAGFAVEQHGDVVVGGQGDALDQRQQRRRLGQQLARQQFLKGFLRKAGEIPAAAAAVLGQLGQGRRHPRASANVGQHRDPDQPTDRRARIGR